MADTHQAARHQWVLMTLIFCATALNYVDRQVLALLKPTLQAQFHWSNSDYAHLGDAFQFSAAFALVFVGWFVDRLGVKKAYSVAVAVWSLAGMGHAFASTVAQFIAARMALSVAESVNTPAAVKGAAVYMPLKVRSISLGLINTAPNIGAILTPLLIPPLALAYGWKAAFILTGGLGFVWLVFWIVGTRKLKPIAHVDGHAETAPKNMRETVSELGLIVRDRRTWTVIIAKAMTDQIWWFMLFWLPDLFAKQFHLTQGTFGWPIALVYLMAAFGALSSGLLFPALLRRGFTVNSARKTSMLFYAVLILPIPLALLALSPWVAALLIGLALFAHQGFSTNVFGMTADIIPSARVATIVALGGACGNFAAIGAHEFNAWALNHGYGYTPMFINAAIAYLLATLWVQLLQPVLTPAIDEASA